MIGVALTSSAMLAPLVVFALLSIADPAGAAAAPAGAVVEQKKARSVLVLPLSTSAGVDAGTLGTITSTLAVSVQKHAGLSVLTGEDVKRMAQVEADKQLLGCDTASASCIAEIAGAMGADLALYGDVGKLGDVYVVNLNLFDAGQAKAVGRQGLQVKSLDESFITQLDIAVTTLLAPVTGEKTTVSAPSSAAADVPTIDLEALKKSGLKSINMKAENALERALDAQDDKSSTPERKRDAWCALAVVEGANPYLATATKACTEWKQYVVANRALEKNLAADYATLAGFLALRHKSTDQKLDAVDSFLKTYARIGNRPMVRSVRAARERLVATGNASLDDADKDGLTDDLDKCVNAAEDVDGFEDDDGCPDPDNDKDGVPDVNDKCPDEAGVADKGGCPETIGDVASKAKSAAGDFLHDAVDFYAFDFDRPVMLRIGASADAAVDPLGRGISPGVAVGLRWAALDLGARGEVSLDKPGSFLLGGHLGLGALQIPRGSFGLLNPSVGVDVLGAPGEGELVLGPYVANTFRVWWLQLTVSYRYEVLHKGGGADLPDQILGAELSAAAPAGSIGDALAGKGDGGDVVDFFALDTKRDAFFGVSGIAESGLDPFGTHAALGFGIHVSWAALEAGYRMSFDLDSSGDVPLLLGGNIGLAAFQVPKGDFGLLNPSVGIDGDIDVSDVGGALFGPYVANTFNLNVARARIWYRYGLLGTDGVDLPVHTVGAELTLNVSELLD